MAQRLGGGGLRLIRNVILFPFAGGGGLRVIRHVTLFSFAGGGGLGGQSRNVTLFPFVGGCAERPTSEMAWRNSCCEAESRTVLA